MTSHDCHTRHTSDTLPVFIFFRGKRTFDSVFHMKLDLISSEPVLFYSFDFYIDVNKNQKNKTKNQFCWNVFFWKKKKFFFPSLDLSLKKESKEYLNPHSCACIKQFLWWFFTKDSSFCHIILQPKTSLNQKNHQILTFFRRKLFLIPAMRSRYFLGSQNFNTKVRTNEF